MKVSINIDSIYHPLILKTIIDGMEQNLANFPSPNTKFNDIYDYSKDIVNNYNALYSLKLEFEKIIEKAKTSNIVKSPPVS